MADSWVLLFTQINFISNMIVHLSSVSCVNSGETINMKLEDQLRDTMRLKHLSLKTEESYVGWYRRYVLWHGKKHPAEMGAAEVEAFLTHLAVERKLAAVILLKHP